MSYTIKNLRDTKDQAAEFGLSDVGEAHFPREELSAQSVGLAYHVLKPDRRQAFGHRHDDAEEVYVVIAGDGRVRLDERIEEVGELDAIRVAPEITRAFEAGPAGMTVLAFGPRFEGDGKLVHDFWVD